MDHHKRRTFIKNKPQNLWRDNFKKHCLEQFRRSREAQINQRRFGSKEILSEEEVCSSQLLYFALRSKFLKIFLLSILFSCYYNLLKTNGKGSC
ncbi:hypothetical protein C1645_278395 [Glomus cerebriforme]|uniref:RPA-interacting protein N-terminal domain-containing protein n=1 Tax=Glomus cerebriforme TaxID=658196 RepID=A0A397TNT3_9GLOM|nr:hypothetical protein C1645_278395 [Glomus cerebriforme]